MTGLGLGKGSYPTYQLWGLFLGMLELDGTVLLGCPAHLSSSLPSPGNPCLCGLQLVRPMEQKSWNLGGCKEKQWCSHPTNAWLPSKHPHGTLLTHFC